MASTTPWTAGDKEQAKEARSKLDVWPLDEHNAVLLNEVHPRGYNASDNDNNEQTVYDLVVIGAGAGGLVSSKQAARRGAKSCMISARLAGGDCLNVGCVPSKALLRSAHMFAQVKKAAEFGIVLDGEAPAIDFPSVMKRMRQLRAKIAPADGHEGTVNAGARVYQGRGRFIGLDRVQVDQGTILQFRKAVVATGGRTSIPSNIPGLKEAPYTTNEILFNLQTLPPRMVILGAGVVALEMAQTFATFGSQVTVIQRSERLFRSKYGDEEASRLLKNILEHENGIAFLSSTTTESVETLREANDEQLPLMRVRVKSIDDGSVRTLECECLLVATGRVANVEDLGLEAANVEYELGKGMIIDDLAQSVTNPNVYGVGDCVADVPRLTHNSGEMAKLVVQNSLFDDDWKVSSLVVPAVMYTQPEYATVGIASQEMAAQQGIDVDVYRTGLEHNDRAILESDNVGFCKVICKKGTEEILGATIVAARAGEMINEISLAIKNNLGMTAIGRNIHAYPTTGEAVQFCGIQYINSRWKRLD